MIYDYECVECGAVSEHHRKMTERHDTPLCACGSPTRLLISPVMGRVKFPAAGGHEYVSPVSGKPITSERARREDMKRHGCRPWEGQASERKESLRVKAEEEAKSDAKLDVAARTAVAQLPPAKKRELGI